MKLSKVLADKRGGDKIYTINAGTTIKEAAKKLGSLRIGCLLVVEPASSPVKYVGIISERDIIKAISSDGIDISVVKVDEIMTKNLIVANKDDDVEYVMNVMTRHNIRHLPIIGGKTVIGLVSRGDIINTIQEDREIQIRWLSDYTGGSHKSEVF